jgi:SOS-response transcriptional repressor LexA
MSGAAPCRAQNSAPLTPRARELLEFLGAFISAHGISPTLGEMCIALGINSRVSIHKLLGRLERGNYIRRMWNRQRTIEMVGSARPQEGRCLCDACNPGRYQQMATFIDALNTAPPDSLVKFLGGSRGLV